MDLIYEGITTVSKELFCTSLLLCQNGPDLRRDYDESKGLTPSDEIRVRMDLIYEGITTFLCLLI